MRFLKNLGPNRLSISKIWQLYKNLQNGLAEETPKAYLLDGVLDVMEKIDTESFKKSLRLLYGDRINYLEQSPISLSLLFVKGLKCNDAFDFFDFIKVLSRGNSQ